MPDRVKASNGNYSALGGDDGQGGGGGRGGEGGEGASGGRTTRWIGRHGGEGCQPHQRLQMMGGATGTGNPHTKRRFVLRKLYQTYHTFSINNLNLRSGSIKKNDVFCFVFTILLLV